ncbi:family 3 adenylate cyclase [Nitzschia inconspicua]|uniref:Family 3 adenylate cyclase n=1 Tax=Nitzschia inconspicua TaxID=303405 RepID=A0A9K3KZ35_9STRA|nr:family 3 adenylate cyclase [Nitzschia inconspicua]
MLRNAVQPAMLPSEVTFVELLRKKKKRRRGNRANEEYFEEMLKHDLKTRKKSKDGKDDLPHHGSYSFSEVKCLNDHDNSSRNDSSGIDSNGESSGTGTFNMGGTGYGFERLLKGKNGMAFISDVRCCLILGLIFVAATLTIGVYAISVNGQEDKFYREFEMTSNQVYESANRRILEVFGELERISFMTASFAKQEQQRYEKLQEQRPPEGFVTIPDVEYILGSARESMQADFVAYLPSIKSQQQSEYWAKYNKDNIGWLVESTEVYDSMATKTQTGNETTVQQDTDSAVHYEIWRYEIYDKNGLSIDYGSSTCPMWSTYKKRPDTYDKHALQAAEAIEAERIFPYFPELSPPVGAPLSPVWTSSPPYFQGKPSIINFNAQSDPSFQHMLQVVGVTRKTTFADVCSPTAPWMEKTTLQADRYAIVITPMFGDVLGVLDTDNPIIGHFMALVPWTVFFSETIGDGNLPVTVGVTNDCGRSFSMVVQNGNSAIFLNHTSDGKPHREEFNDMKLELPLAPFAHPKNSEGFACAFNVSIYPTETMEEAYNTNMPIIYAMIVLVCFAFTSFAFIAFDCLQQRRQRHLVNTAMRQNLLVSALFPKKIQDQLFEDMKQNDKQKSKLRNQNKSGTAGLRQFLEREHANSGSFDAKEQSSRKKVKPIADLFPATTIMFADITGFTAWSSEREPCQVFILLESIYKEFDRIAKKRRVFKVEVVGDCYVAVCGLPDPRKKHAVVMAKFAADCMAAMSLTVKKLEKELGPDTSDLKLRIGLHSGPVVAGVLRGDRCRFQLFGDTMNTASRMESTCLPNHIQISQDTADILIAFGKEEWVVPREDKVEAKGKGALSTYFLVLEDSSEGGNDASSVGASSSANGSLIGSHHSRNPVGASDGSEERRNSSIDWTVEVLANVLKAIVARRNAKSLKPSSEKLLVQLEQASIAHDGTKIVIDELSSYVALPGFDDADFGVDSKHVVLPGVVVEELKEYVQSVAELYNNSNPFHNFDHANHVVLSVNKLLSRINSPDIEGGDEELFNHTFGIASAPLTWFVVILSALIHDVDHSGVSNSQLLKEKSPLSFLYQNKSVAEQNSFDIGWDLLMEDTYRNMRRTIYSTTGEFKRFRQLMVNSVLATDIFDKDLNRHRQERWDKAFNQIVDPEMMDEFDKEKSVNLKASIVIEHLLQASDVSHTMQHWHIYRKWNERLYMEMYKAYFEGRMEEDPTDFWYMGEIGFFDDYVIPLAQKLHVCGLFGVSSAEHLNYAEQNRSEWVKRGERIVVELATKANAKFKRSKNKE